jgi:transposase
MDTHKNAPLTPKGREAMVGAVVDGGLPKAAAAHQFNTRAKTVAKWVERFCAEGVDGLRDRSSRPLSLPNQPAPATCAVIEVFRRQRHTGKQIAAETGVSPAIISRILRRLGLNRLSALEPAEPVRRYERERPGELIHIDIKKLGKFNRIGHRIIGDRAGQSNQRARGQGPGWEYVHICKVCSNPSVTQKASNKVLCRNGGRVCGFTTFNHGRANVVAATVDYRIWASISTVAVSISSRFKPSAPSVTAWP